MLSGHTQNPYPTNAGPIFSHWDALEPTDVQDDSSIVICIPDVL